MCGSIYGRRVVLASVRIAGREVAYAEWGDPQGFPVLVMHGTPGSRLGRWSDDAALAATGARQVGINRPGYGDSDRLEGRTVAAVVPDVLAVADALRIDRFAISGASGGGPHALAVAALAPERVVRCRVTSSLAPAGIPRFFDGMDAHNIEEWDLVQAGLALPEVTRRAALMRSRVLTDPGSIFADIALPASDQAAMNERAAFAVRTESLLEALTTPFGWYDDDVAFAQPWGFDLEQVLVPVELRYGRHDVFVPPSHGEWLAAALPHAQVTCWDDQGHLGDSSVLADLRALVTACHRV
jgi:pimeloyl-ACP methyl ester carboxylesterase